MLLCLGDSLTHGNVSASITPEIPLKLCGFLGLPTPDYGKTFADPLWVVNAGQNMITSHTILHERLHTSMGVYPDYKKARNAVRLLTEQVRKEAAMLQFERDALMDAGGEESHSDVLGGATGWGGAKLDNSANDGYDEVNGNLRE